MPWAPAFVTLRRRPSPAVVAAAQTFGALAVTPVTPETVASVRTCPSVSLTAISPDCDGETASVATAGSRPCRTGLPERLTHACY